MVRRILLTVLLAGILLSSCGGQAATSPTPDMNAILTAGVGTFAAAIFQTQTALVPPATDTPTITPTATASPIPLASPTASATQLVLVAPTVVVIVTSAGTQPTPNPTSLASGCNNLLFLDDETVPPGTVFKPLEVFTKKWKVANTGTCDWVYRYQLVFTGGDRMGGEPSTLGKVIEPGKWTQLSIELQAPEEPGKYIGYWRFADQNGNMFGSTLGVSIKVEP